CLVGNVAVVQILAEAKVHARFPVVEAGGLHHARDQFIDGGLEIDDDVWFQRELVHAPDPLRICAAHGRARHQRKRIPVGEDDKSRAQRGDHLVLQAVGEIGGVEQAHRHAAERVAFLGRLQALPGECRPRHPGVEHRVSSALEPFPEQPDVRGAADAVGALEDDQLALQLAWFNCREALTIECKSTHLRILVFLAPVSAFVTSVRISACCSSMERLASMTTRPNSLTMLSYASTTAPWKRRKLSSMSPLTCRSMPAS